jgi:hypothetical protein
MNASKLVGRAAALKCVLITDYRADGTLGVYAEVDRNIIPYAYLQRAKRWAFAGRPYFSDEAG